MNEPMRTAKALLLFMLLAGFCAAQSPAAGKATGKKTSSKVRKPMSAKAIHDSALIIDTHADTTQRLLDEKYDMVAPPQGDEGHFNLHLAKKGGLDAEFMSIWVEPKFKGQFGLRTMQLIDSVLNQVERHPSKLALATSPDEILAAKKAGKLALLMGIEGGHSIENDLGMLRNFHRLGVRYMTLTWSNTNEWADSSGDINDETVKHHNGLTQFGREVVREMNRLGMMVDISHVSDKTFWNTLTVSRAPVIASHSSARALNGHMRNMTDDMLRGMKENNGVVMVNFFSAFIDEDYRQKFIAQAKERAAAQAALAERTKTMDPKSRAEEEYKLSKELASKIPRPPLKSLIDHFDHIAKVAGVDHVGLGSDFDGVSSLPAGIDTAADLPKITEELLKRGYSKDDIHKMLGGNLMRVFRDVEKVSKQMRAEGEQLPLLPKKAAN